ncbi:hypothetical protein [Sedimenticola sp.]|uniref:hypothetical protein n=1 Tax=Sedimenticola sp. TaxID=1940285 RepID=UPI003D0DC809
MPWFGVSLRRVSGRNPRNEGSKAEEGSEVYREIPDKPIEAATTDAYNESEQVSGFFSLIEDNFVVPL